MQITSDQDPRLLAWASDRLAATFSPDTCRWLAGVDNGLPVWVVVYAHFTGNSCQLSIATDGTKRWATRRSLREIFDVPFRQWGLRRVEFLVAADNAASLRMMTHRGRSPLGVVFEGRIRCACPGNVDGIVFGMLKEECKWLTG